MNASAPFLPGAGRFNRRLALSALLALMLIIPAAIQPARAHATSPLDFSAGDQYVETLPTAKGPKVTENAPKHRNKSGLSKKVQKQIAAVGGSEGATLQNLAESQALGAPAPTDSSSGSSEGSSSSKKGKTKGGSAKGSPSVPSAAINAAGGTGSGLGWLALALPLITAVALGAFGLQRRNRDEG